MQFPFDEPDDDTDSRRIPRALAICLTCVLLVGLFGLWNLIYHRHQATQEAELATGAVERAHNEGASTRFETLTCDVIVARPNRPPRLHTVPVGAVPVGSVRDVMQQSILNAASDQQAELTPANSGENEFKSACRDGWEPYAVRTIHDSSGATIERHYLRREAPKGTDNHSTGFWLSREEDKSNEEIVLSLTDSSELKNETMFRQFQHLDQNFARAAIGRKLERGQRVFLSGFDVDLLPPESEQDATGGADGKTHARGLWITHELTGGSWLGYDREKLSAKDKRRGAPARRWIRVANPFVLAVVGRDLNRGERAFCHDPKVDNSP